MKVLFLSQYFPPEIEPSAIKISELAKSLVAQGHQATVLTGFPNYPTGVIPKEYRGRLTMREEMDGVSVVRTSLIPSPSGKFVRRTIGEASFTFSAILRGMGLSQHQVLFCTSPPLEIGLAGYALSRLKRIPLIFEVRDAFPKVAVQIGALKNPFAIRTAEALEKFMYRKAKRIVVVTDWLGEHVIEQGAAREKVCVIPHAVDTELFKPMPKEGWVRENLKLQGKFIVTYAGTHGLQAHLSSVLEAAELLRDHGDIQFLFIGDGAEKQALIKERQQRNLDNVTMLEPQVHHELPHFLAASDALIAHNSKMEPFNLYTPVKVYEYMAMGRPILLGIDGRAQGVIDEAGAGISVGSENPKGMAQAILKLYRDRSLCETLGRNGRLYAEKHHSRAKQVSVYLQVLEGALPTHPGNSAG